MRSRALFTFAIFVVSLAGPMARADFTTPIGSRVLTRGGCLLTQARVGAEGIERDYAWCDKLGGGMSTQYLKAYEWSPDWLVEAFDNAERAICANGALGCIVQGRDVELAVVADGIANAFIQGDKKQIRVAVTTGMIDFVEAGVMAYIDEARAQTSGQDSRALTNWIQAIDDLSSKSCDFHGPSPFHRVSETQFLQQRVGAQAFFEFLMGHELAHARARDCGATRPVTELSREIACDLFSFSALARPSSGSIARAGPPLIVAPLVGMAHYESVLGDRLGALAAPTSGGTLLELAPARNWRLRGRSLVDAWEKHCERAGADATTCRGGWEAAVVDAKRLLALPLPAACKVNAPVEPSVSRSPIPEAPAPTPLCVGVRDLLSAAGGAFAGLRSPLQKDKHTTKDGDTIWAPRSRIDGVRACDLWHYADDNSDAARCVIAQGESSQVEARFAAADRELRDCLGRAWTFDERRTKTCMRLRARSESSRSVVKLELSGYSGGTEPQELELELIVE